MSRTAQLIDDLLTAKLGHRPSEVTDLMTLTKFDRLDRADLRAFPAALAPVVLHLMHIGKLSQ